MLLNVTGMLNSPKQNLFLANDKHTAWCFMPPVAIFRCKLGNKIENIKVVRNKMENIKVIDKFIPDEER